MPEVKTRMFSQCLKCKERVVLVDHPAGLKMVWIHVSSGTIQSQKNGTHIAKDHVDLKNRVLEQIEVE